LIDNENGDFVEGAKKHGKEDESLIYEVVGEKQEVYSRIETR